MTHSGTQLGLQDTPHRDHVGTRADSARGMRNLGISTCAS